jgi:DNA-binding protein HU-beta
MNRSEFVAAVAERSGLSQADTDKALNAMLDEIGRVVSHDGEKLTIPGYLTIQRAHRAARNGRNPQTGEVVQIKATNVPKISAGAKLKAAAAGS